MESENFACMVERVVDVAEYVFFSDIVVYAVLLQGEEGLGVDAGQDELCIGFLTVFEEFSHQVQACCVD